MASDDLSFHIRIQYREKQGRWLSFDEHGTTETFVSKFCDEHEVGLKWMLFTPTAR